MMPVYEPKSMACRIHTRLTVLIVAFQLIFAGPAAAGTIRYEHDLVSGSPSVSGEVQADQVGPVKNAEPSQVVFSGNILEVLGTIDLARKDQSKPVQLRGVTFGVSSDKQAGQRRVAGFVFFNGGEKLKDLDKPDAEEKVVVSGGVTYRGRIQTVTAREITILTGNSHALSINTARIRRVSSPRIFRFTMAGKETSAVSSTGAFTAEANRLRFYPTYADNFTGKGNELARGKGTWSSRKKIVVAAIAALAVAAAIAIPLAVAIPLASRNRSAPRPLFFSLSRPASAAPTVSTGVPAGGGGTGGGTGP